MFFKWIKSYWDIFYRRYKKQIEYWSFIAYAGWVAVLFFLAIPGDPSVQVDKNNEFAKSINDFINSAHLMAVQLLIVTFGFPVLLLLGYVAYKGVMYLKLDYEYFAANGGKLKREQLKREEENKNAGS